MSEPAVLIGGVTTAVLIDHEDDEPAVVIEVPTTQKVVTISGSGPQGSPGAPGPAGGSAYVHTQSTPSAGWTVAHGLGHKPLVQVEVGGEVVLSDIQFIDDNNLFIEFASACSGTATLI